MGGVELAAEARVDLVVLDLGPDAATPTAAAYFRLIWRTAWKALALASSRWTGGLSSCCVGIFCDSSKGEERRPWAIFCGRSVSPPLLGPWPRQRRSGGSLECAGRERLVCVPWPRLDPA